MSKTLKAVFPAEAYEYFYEEVLSPERTSLESDFLIKALGIVRWNRVADICCWNGRHVRALHRRWLDVTWFDSNQDFVRLRQKDGLLLQDFFLYPLCGAFQSGYCFHTSFWFGSDSENEVFFRNVMAWIEEGWKFLLDLPNPDFMRTKIGTFELKKPFWILKDDVSYDSKRKRMNVKRTYEFRWSTIDGSYSLRLYEPEELEAIGKILGMHVEKLYWGYDFSSFNRSRSKRVIMVFRKVDIVSE